MGSGSSGPYGGGSTGSQPYAPSYHVESSMKKHDIESGVYKGKYIKNPTAQKLTDMINGNYIGNKTTNESGLPYVIDMDGNIIVGKRSGNGRGPGALPTPHPTLIGGSDPQVQMAGLLKIGGGKILGYDNNSGHYKPNAKSMTVADEAFSKLPDSLFSKKFKRRTK
ncbi:MAG: hypothetical protein E7521_08475 [Ruminococcaceae bacterium]|nr:hypothetical protein [Oscillospiraceae bacterium]